MNIPYGPLLVVEDIPNIRELLEVTLRFKGYPVVSACNGQEALEIAVREHPALVITDILMPRLDGFALAYSLRSNPKTCSIPIIFLSATYVAPEDKAFALSLGAARFLEKPVDTDEFLLTVADVLTNARASLPQPMDLQAYHDGYRKRLEHKLRHKTTQILRTERLIESLPPSQRGSPEGIAAYESILNEARLQRDEIQRELQQLNL